MELIDKKPLIINLIDWQMEQFAEVGHEKEFNLLDMIIRGVENEPTIDAKKVVYGKWIKLEGNWKSSETGEPLVVHQCSECGNYFVHAPYNFCPECGSDMRGKV